MLRWTAIAAICFAGLATMIIGILIVAGHHGKLSAFDQCESQLVTQIHLSERHPGRTFQQSPACATLAPAQRQRAIREAAADA